MKTISLIFIIGLMAFEGFAQGRTGNVEDVTTDFIIIQQQAFSVYLQTGISGTRVKKLTTNSIDKFKTIPEALTWLEYNGWEYLEFVGNGRYLLRRVKDIPSTTISTSEVLNIPPK